jgi:predicted permease
MANFAIHDNATPVIIGATSIIYSVYTAEIVVMFLCAVLGAGIGLAFRPAQEPVKSKVEMLLRFAGNTGYILIMAVLTAFLSYYFKRWIDGSIYPLSVFVSMILMLYREKIIAIGGAILARKGETL